jgi:endonuclease III
MSVARALAFRERAGDETNADCLHAIDRAVNDIEKRVKRIDEIIKAGRIVEQKGSGIQEIAQTLKAELVEQIEVLRANLAALGGDDDAEDDG